MLTDNQWNSISNYVRSKLDYYYDPSILFAEQDGLRKQMELKHKGLYIGFSDSKGQDLLREGFLREGCLNVLQSIDLVVDNVYTFLRNKSIPISTIHTGTFHFVIVSDVVYIPNPLAWDENRDGVFFQWGENYKALYLPYQIKHINLSKIEVLDRLCSHEAGTVANLWRLPEGLIWRIFCHSYDS